MNQLQKYAEDMLKLSNYNARKARKLAKRNLRKGFIWRHEWEYIDMILREWG